MKLVRLHVDNFGTLSNYDLDLTNDLNSILQDNGWGKTTLTVFIKSMLYGLNPSKARDLDKNERSKFTPWNNGVFGGTLEFEYKDKQYRIERTFGKKESEDDYHVFDLKTNKEVTNKFMPSVGEEIFKIDGESFEKSMFIPQKDFDFKFGDTLTSKLSNLFGNLDDCNNAIEGRNRIDTAKNAITKKSGGQLTSVKDQIKELENIIDKKENDIKAIPQIQERLKDCDENISAIKDKIKEIDAKFILIGDAATKQANKKQAESKQKDIKEKEDKLAKYSESLAKKDPDSIDVESLETLNNETNALHVKKQTLINDSFDNNGYEKLKSIFNEHPLDDKKIDDVKKQIAKYNSFEPQMAINNAPISNKKKLSPLMIALLVIGGVVMIAGFVLIAFVLIAGIICAFVGLIGLICGLVMYLTKNNNTNTNTVTYVPNNDPEKLKIENSLKEFFNQYKLYEMHFSDNLNQLVRQWDDFKKLKSQYENKQKTLKDIDNDLETHEKKLNAELSIYKLTSLTNAGKINELRILKNAYITLRRDIENEKNKYKAFYEENKLNEEDSKIDFDQDELTDNKKALLDSLDEIQNRRTELANNLDVLNESATTIDEDKNNKLALEQNKIDLKHRADILGAAMKFIDETDELIKAKYVKPMTDSVKKYMDELLKSEALDFNVDTDFNFNGIEDSKQKEIKYYSKGYQQAIAICLRLALIDCLFKSEKPFLLLDDPFVDLDNTKLKQAKDLLKEISKNIQVTYLTCHDSRSI